MRLPAALTPASEALRPHALAGRSVPSIKTISCVGSGEVGRLPQRARLGPDLQDRRRDVTTRPPRLALRPVRMIAPTSPPPVRNDRGHSPAAPENRKLDPAELPFELLVLGPMVLRNGRGIIADSTHSRRTLSYRPLGIDSSPLICDMLKGESTSTDTS